MNAIRQRARIARVRGIQHGIASIAAAKAAGHVQFLEANEQRLKAMREGLAANAGTTCGATLAGIGELAMRLEAAREGLGPTIASAKVAARLREEARIGARREQDCAEKLERKAASAAARADEKRAGANFRPRTRIQPLENDQ